MDSVDKSYVAGLVERRKQAVQDEAVARKACMTKLEVALMQAVRRSEASLLTGKRVRLAFSPGDFRANAGGLFFSFDPDSLLMDLQRSLRGTGLGIVTRNDRDDEYADNLEQHQVIFFITAVRDESEA